MTLLARNMFRMTEERMQLIGFFVSFRYLRMRHLYLLYRAKSLVTDRAVRRLVRDFWAHGYLHRRIAPSSSPKPLPVGEFAYWLSAKGTAIAEDSGIAASVLPVPRRAVARTLEHELTITDFHLRAEQFTSSQGLTLHWEQYGLRRGVNPDAFFAVTDPSRPRDEGTSYGFLEIERSRLGGYVDGRSVLLRRLRRYAEYQGSAGCKVDWKWFDEFRVVVVVTSEARRRNLLALLADELPLPIFWVSVDGADLGATPFMSPTDFHERGYSLAD